MVHYSVRQRGVGMRRLFLIRLGSIRRFPYAGALRRLRRTDSRLRAATHTRLESRRGLFRSSKKIGVHVHEGEVTPLFSEVDSHVRLPNKALEPTRPSGTSRAEPRLAP